MMEMEKMVIGRSFNRDKYGMIYPPICAMEQRTVIRLQATLS